MGRAEERRARQRGGRRAAPRRSSGAPTGGAASGRAAARRAARRGRTGKGGIRRLFTWKKLLGAALGVCLLGIGAFIVLYMMVGVPQGNAVAQQESNVYKYSDGTILARAGKVNRESVSLEQVPKAVQHCFVAAENKSFYHDAGIDLKGTARGLLNTLTGKGTQGGSTITQQYVKNYYLNQDQTVTRKLKELVISLKVDQQMSKDDILAGYINTSYYGRGAYGIQAAAQAYYRVDAKDLTVEQGAYLAALLQAPSQYDWAVASDTGKKLVRQRWDYVLDNMVEQHWLDAAKRQAMKFPVPKEPQGAPGLEGQKGYLIDLADKQLEAQLMKQEGITQAEAEAEVVGRGWTITLNIDKKKQAALEKAVEQQLTSKLDPEKRKVDADVQAAAVSVDPKTGGIVALYGGEDYFKHYYNNATRKDYQPASTFKPVILAAALDEGATTQDGKPINADTIYDGTSGRQVVDHGTKVGFGPPNEDDVSYGDITVQTAMNKSVNSVFAQMGVDVGMQKVMDVAAKLGMDTEGMQPVPAQTLGSMGASPLEMAAIYATLDNHGKKVTPSILKSASNRSRTADIEDPIGDQVISREAADTVTSVLTGVVDDGTARASVRDNPLRRGQQVAGKTGTSDENKSAWFTGYTPDLVTSVGLFGEDAKTHAHTSLAGATGLIPGSGRINGGGYPAQIWAAYTFGVLDKTSTFDLDTTQGAAVQPSWTPSATQSPSETPSETPTSAPPTTSAPPSESPSQTPSDAPSQTPSQSPSGTAPSTSEPPDDGEDGDGGIFGNRDQLEDRQPSR
ncbi:MULTISPECIES: transglycosylase domain-containing protein [Streptomyces]|uniref:Penicillin-binding protein n=1 Tax=Streptomyces thermoviolaceus subsp. thermoviolaceus TaxID=66860 RepID=A0ABX0YXX6_STRTL|nr:MULTISPECIES: transglycosylase domain-containing protein [Streptomyces]MCM3262872.1 transglycosylase domain-containing protein [Streptomyces thermoviolaceus]NJP15930.1 penicillin-binding protein [Streptomyces thermoviolaceus subsp. thermoviolaceus]RSS07790.1 penicillin-binding protein [Streptomyces sp. WAC00469]WTD47646.1 transglycosylase domain-containing protein [Streptomyces thermoviolaceus]GGV79837.1 penicillin-binding protein [Streptomyces thermoviolaceus subsp. apingens]